MNGIERITGRIAADAQAEVEARLGKAREEAEKIAASYRAQAESEGKDLAERSAKAAAEREERLVSMAQMEARKTILAAKQEMVEKAYDRALEKLNAMPKEEYIAVLARLMVQASTTGMEEAIFSPKDRERLGQKAVTKANKDSGKHMELSDETRDIHGGFILKDRNVEVNCTFETLVRLQKAETAGAVGKMLF